MAWWWCWLCITYHMAKISGMLWCRIIYEICHNSILIVVNIFCPQSVFWKCHCKLNIETQCMKRGNDPNPGLEKFLFIIVHVSELFLTFLIFKAHWDCRRRPRSVTKSGGKVHVAVNNDNLFVLKACLLTVRLMEIGILRDLYAIEILFSLMWAIKVRLCRWQSV